MPRVFSKVRRQIGKRPEGIAGLRNFQGGTDITDDGPEDTEAGVASANVAGIDQRAYAVRKSVALTVVRCRTEDAIESIVGKNPDLLIHIHLLLFDGATIRSSGAGDHGHDL